jgi:hypothetical protein
VVRILSSLIFIFQRSHHTTTCIETWLLTAKVHKFSVYNLGTDRIRSTSNNSFSSWVPATSSSVSQGSILRPLLYLLYTAVLPVSTESTSAKFADDTTVLATDSNSDIVWQKVRNQPRHKRRMTSSGMLRRVALVRTDVSEELNAAIIWVLRIGELGTT